MIYTCWPTPHTFSVHYLLYSLSYMYQNIHSCYKIPLDPLYEMNINDINILNKVSAG